MRVGEGTGLCGFASFLMRAREWARRTNGGLVAVGEPDPRTIAMHAANGKGRFQPTGRADARLWRGGNEVRR